jgi:hypothetical protein
MKRTGALVLLLAAVAMALMPAQTAALTVAGFSGASCGSWTQARVNHQSPAMDAWALGFVSGVNYGRSNIEGKDILQDTDADSLYDWLDCSSRPLETFTAAVARLAIALRANATARIR